jgi:ribbon-helix-helix protein, copG family
MGEEKRSERVAVRLTPSLKEAVTELASRENRSLSNYIELLLSEKVESIKK